MSEPSKQQHEPHGATAHGLPVSPSMEPSIEAAQLPTHSRLVDRRVVFMSALAILIGLTGALIAQGLKMLIGLITNVCFYGHFSVPDNVISPAAAVSHLGWWVVPIPVIGGLIVGVIARYGSAAIRGHGIPEAMESILTDESRVPFRVTLLKPLGSAIAIGTGGPFGAEGPIIATGGALGSFVGQVLPTAAIERKTLLAAGAAAGMAATFGAPVSSVLLAVELLLFEYRPRSFIPVAFAAAAAAGLRIPFEGLTPIFAMPNLSTPDSAALAVYVGVGAVMGLVAVFVTQAVYWVEDLFDLLPVHWMWWPAIGAIPVGVIGYFAPRTLGVGYAYITAILSGEMARQAGLWAVGLLGLLKFISWAISLSSGTSGGTLAPLFTIGGAMGAVMGMVIATWLPALGVDPRIAALVGMAAIFAGSARAMLTSAVFAFETTLQPVGLLPLLSGCAAAYLVSALVMEQTIMTEKIARRGIDVPDEYAADPLTQMHVHDLASPNPVALRTNQSLEEVRQWFDSGEPDSRYGSYPVVNEEGIVAGVVTRRSVRHPEPESAGDGTVGSLIRRPPVIAYDQNTLREAVDHMVRHRLGQLPVVKKADPSQLVGILTRGDVLRAYDRQVKETRRTKTPLSLPFRRRKAKEPCTK